MTIRLQLSRLYRPCLRPLKLFKILEQVRLSLCKTFYICETVQISISFQLRRPIALLVSPVHPYLAGTAPPRWTNWAEFFAPSNQISQLRIVVGRRNHNVHSLPIFEPFARACERVYVKLLHSSEKENFNKNTNSPNILIDRPPTFTPALVR